MPSSRRFSGLSRALGGLTGGAVAICGASAARAIAAVLPRRDGLQRDLLFTVVAVMTLSTIAMVAHPLLLTALGFDEQRGGMLIGLTIHDVAQVVGAGYTISDAAGDQAPLSELMRVLPLPVVILALGLALRDQREGRTPMIQPFVLGFIVCMLVNSFIELPSALRETLNEMSRWLLISAIAALGVKTSLASMLDLGGPHIALVVALSVLLLTAAMLGAEFLLEA